MQPAPSWQQPHSCTSVVGRSCWFIVRSRKQRYLRQSESEPIVWNTTFSFSDFTLAHLSFLLSPHLDLAQFKQQFHSSIIWLHLDKALSYQHILHMLKMRLVFCFCNVCKVLSLRFVEPVSVITCRVVWTCVCACVFAGDCEKVSDTWPLKQPRVNGHNRSQWPYQLFIPLPQQQGTAFEPRAPLVVWAGMVFSQVWLHQCCDSPHMGGERYKTLQGLPSRSRGKWNMENVTGILWHFAPWAFLKRVKRQLRSGNDSSEHESAAGRDTLHRFNPSTS